MAWMDRIKEAAYTSPSGQRVVFAYEDVSVTYEKKGAAFDFPDAGGTYVQDLGRSGRKFPLTMFFYGSNCDLQAELFVAMVGETGQGKLEHPMYGTVDVVPFGEISRKDNLKSGANQVIIELTFWETIGLIYPTSQTDALSAVLQALIAYNAAVAEQFAASVLLNTPNAKAGLMGDISAALGTVKSALAKIATADAEVQQKFTAINRSITDNLDELVGDPLMLALQTTLFVQQPARAITARVQSRLDAYHQIIDVITGRVERPGFGPRNSNAFKARDLCVSGAMSGQVSSVLNNSFTTKGGAIQAADAILTQMDTVTNWREANYVSLSEVDSGQAYTALQSSVALAAGYLVEIAFTLKQERVLTLTRNRTIIDLVAELYGSVDDQLDFFISSNGLTGSEILELPRGRRIAYYV